MAASLDMSLGLSLAEVSPPAGLSVSALPGAWCAVTNARLAAHASPPSSQAAQDV